LYRLKEKYEQSTNPFHADIEALRAVSTVPPMTTSFCEIQLKTLTQGGEGAEYTNQCVLDRASVEAKWCQKALDGLHIHASVTSGESGGRGKCGLTMG
jgi:hypothetical protein